MPSKYFCACIAAGILTVSVDSAPVLFEERVSALLRVREPEAPGIYKVSRRGFSNADVDRILKAFEQRGFSVADQKRDLQARVFPGRSSSQFLRIEESTGGIHFHDQAPVEPVGMEASYLGKLKDISDKLLVDLLGMSVGEYVMTHLEDGYMAGRYSARRHVSRTFRYVRKVDGRLVEGTTSHARITIAWDGRIRSVDLTHPVITRERMVPKVAKGDWQQERLRKELLRAAESPGYGKVTRSQVRKAVRALTVSGNGPQAFLSPSLLFTVHNDKEDGSQETLEISLKEDANEVENLDVENSEEYHPNLKQ